MNSKESGCTYERLPERQKNLHSRLCVRLLGSIPRLTKDDSTEQAQTLEEHTFQLRLKSSLSRKRHRNPDRHEAHSNLCQFTRNSFKLESLNCQQDLVHVEMERGGKKRDSKTTR